MKVFLIAAMDSKGGIGKDGKIPWRSKMDLEHFKLQTTGGVLVMGRKTWESLPGRLPGRNHYVISREHPEGFDGEVNWFNTYGAALGHIACFEPEGTNCWVIGGEQIYRQALSTHVDAIIVTVFEDLDTGADTFLPVKHWWDGERFEDLSGEFNLRMQLGVTPNVSIWFNVHHAANYETRGIVRKLSQLTWDRLAKGDYTQDQILNVKEAAVKEVVE